MNNQGDRAFTGEHGLEALFNGEIRQFAETVRDVDPPQSSSQYPTRGEINRQIMDATRPLLDQIAELTRMVATLVEPRPQNVQASSSCNTRSEPSFPQYREGNEFRPNHQHSGTRSDILFTDEVTKKFLRKQNNRNLTKEMRYFTLSFYDK